MKFSRLSIIFLMIIFILCLAALFSYIKLSRVNSNENTFNNSLNLVNAVHEKIATTSSVENTTNSNKVPNSRTPSAAGFVTSEKPIKYTVSGKTTVIRKVENYDVFELEKDDSTKLPDLSDNKIIVQKNNCILYTNTEMVFTVDYYSSTHTYVCSYAAVFEGDQI